jgi:hypothetical protein
MTEQNNHCSKTKGSQMTNPSPLFRALENLELIIGATEEAQALDDAHDYEISEALDHLEELLRNKMPKHFGG